MANEISAIATTPQPQISPVNDNSKNNVVPLAAPPVVIDTETAVAEATKPRNSIRVNTESVMSKDDLTSAIQSLNDMMSALDRNINFSVDPGTGKNVVRITDSNTGKTIRQIPAQETLNFIKNLDKMVGLLFDSKT